MVAAVLAGGSGRRFGADTPKQLLRLAGTTLVERCVAAFDRAPGIDEVVVVLPADRLAEGEKLLAAGDYRKLTRLVAGGVTRADSTRRALAAIETAARSSRRLLSDGAPPSPEPARPDAECGVLLHDAARPLVDQRIIADCVAALGDAAAVGVAVPSSDTLVEAVDGRMARMPRREALLRCQTPQGFRLPVIARAHEIARADPDFRPTDDCGVVLRYLPDVAVRVVAGDERNIKITYPRDLLVAEALLRADPLPRHPAQPGT